MSPNLGRVKPKGCHCETIASARSKQSLTQHTAAMAVLYSLSPGDRLLLSTRLTYTSRRFGADRGGSRGLQDHRDVHRLHGLYQALSYGSDYRHSQRDPSD